METNSNSKQFLKGPTMVRCQPSKNICVGHETHCPHGTMEPLHPQQPMTCDVSICTDIYITIYIYIYHMYINILCIHNVYICIYIYIFICKYYAFRSYLFFSVSHPFRLVFGRESPRNWCIKVTCIGESWLVSSDRWGTASNETSATRG